MFDVNTMNGSSGTAKIAGIESTAKITSVTSTATKARSRGVATRRPFSTTVNASPDRRSLTGMNLVISRITGFSAGDEAWSPARIRRMPVTARIPPNKYIIQWNC